MSSPFYKLKVSAITHPIKDAVTISFAVPDSLQEVFSYQAGQHLILRFVLEGKELRRSYSLNSSPFANEKLVITVKRVKNGLVSNHINDNLRVGDEIDVLPPQGRFFAQINPKAYKSYFLFAAGSGITPIFSILKSVLVASPYSKVYLLYGNTHQGSIIFKKELENLQNEYPERFVLIQTLSKPKVWTTWETWKGKKGRIDSSIIPLSK